MTTPEKLPVCPVCGNSQFHTLHKVLDRRASGEVFPVGQCSECGLRATLSQPDESEIGRYYESDDYISHTDSDTDLISKLYHKVRSLMLKRKRKIIERLHPQQGKLLDFGSGTGYFLHEMQQAGWQVQGMEVDPSARELARGRFNVRVSEPDFGLLQPASFDVITLWHVLEHLHDPGNAISTFRDALQPGGTLILALPNSDSFDAAHYGAYWDAWDVPRHLWHFTPDSISRLIEQQHMEIIAKYTMPFDVFYIAIRSERHRGASLGLVLAGIKAATWKIRSIFNPERASALMYLVKVKKGG